MEKADEILDVGWKQYRADDDDYKAIRAEVEQSAKDAMLEGEKVRKLLLGTEEAIVNIISYAYEGLGYLWLRTAWDGESFTLEVVDQGIPFNPLAKESSVMEAATLKEVKPGGLGIHIMKCIFDKIAYTRGIFRGQAANHLQLSMLVKNKSSKAI